LKKFLKLAAVRSFAALMALLVAGALLSLALRGRSSPLTSAVGLVAGPLQGLSASLARVFEDIGAYFVSSKALQEELARRDAEIDSLRVRLVDYDDAKKKLATYEKFLGIKTENPGFQFVEASIIGIDAAGQYTFTLDKGSLSGVQAQNPVLDGKNLVGVVAKVGLTTCVVQTILNPKVSVAVYETVSNELGVAENSAELAQYGLCAVPQLARSTAIIPGALICSSGLGGVYPKDLLLGTVTDVSDDSVSATAVVQPAADFAALRDVFVLIGQ
jgi:rod shape-determining protein MreC